MTPTTFDAKRAQRVAYDALVKAESNGDAMIALAKVLWIQANKTEPPEGMLPTGGAIDAECRRQPRNPKDIQKKMRQLLDAYVAEHSQAVDVAAEWARLMPMVEKVMLQMLNNHDQSPRTAPLFQTDYLEALTTEANGNLNRIWGIVEQDKEREGHRAWVAKSGKRGAHPWRGLVVWWFNFHKPEGRRIDRQADERRPAAILHHRLGSVRQVVWEPGLEVVAESGVLPQKEIPESIEQVEQLEIAGTERQRIVRPLQSLYLPMSLIETLAELHRLDPVQVLRSSTRAGAVSFGKRLYWEFLMQANPDLARTRSGDPIDFTLGQLINALYPCGNFHKPHQMRYIIRGLLELRNMRVKFKPKVGGSGMFFPIEVGTIPDQKSTRDFVIEVTVRTPPDTRGGMLVLKKPMRWTGKKSTAQFNAYLTACELFDRFGTRRGRLIDPTKPMGEREADGVLLDAEGKRIVSDGGRAIKNKFHAEAVQRLPRTRSAGADRYPILNDYNLLLACYPHIDLEKVKPSTYRSNLKRAKDAWRALEEESFIRIETLREGWRILPSEEHVNQYRAVQASAEKVE